MRQFSSRAWMRGQTSRQTRRISVWDATSQDLRIMAELTEELGAPPVSPMMRYCGPQAHHLVELAGNAGDWGRLLGALARRYPHLPEGSHVASDGTELESNPERIVWETLRRLQPDDLDLCCHPLLEKGRFLRSDFGICAPDDDTPLVYLEVMGMLGSDRECQTDVEEHSLKRLAIKERWFSEPDRPLLRIIWLDMMAHPEWLVAICEEAFQAAYARMTMKQRSRR
ncbi:hypothetical protein A0U94_05930 [Gluconobacter albidus]|uniref:hypothetical protein n=1 Tax=Gluconobacter albidus TaxID=318683 RepID=UPI00098BC64E|nr:hypothetical protein [Gluconobacter albidus]AQS90576.1 hypothetical protein A0U94_05930 [Gluconobacter albidus]